MTTRTRQQMVEFDELAYQVYTAERQASDQVANLVDTLHFIAGDSRVRSGRFQAWALTNSNAEAVAREAVATGTVSLSWASNAQATITRLDETRAEQTRLKTQAAALDAVYQDAPWPRFFLLTSSDGGHIHATTNCSTTTYKSRFVWLTDLSGLTEADAVAAHGTLLCSVCYPSAPVEWTVGAAKPVDPSVCTGSGAYATNVDHRRYGTPGTCSVCGRRVGCTSTGKARRHKKEG